MYGASTSGLRRFFPRFEVWTRKAVGVAVTTLHVAPRQGSGVTRLWFTVESFLNAQRHSGFSC
jgi:hypothetical protein